MRIDQSRCFGGDELANSLFRRYGATEAKEEGEVTAGGDETV